MAKRANISVPTPARPGSGSRVRLTAISASQDAPLGLVAFWRGSPPLSMAGFSEAAAVAPSMAPP